VMWVGGRLKPTTSAQSVACSGNNPSLSLGDCPT
jgi:hypothetical protein